MALVAVCAGMFLPWVESGTRQRDAFEAVGVADSLGLVDAPWDTVLFVAWHAVPLLAAVSVLQVWTQRRGATVSGAAAAIVAGTGAMIVRSAPVEFGTGVPITIGAAAFGLVALGEWWRTTR